MSIECGVNDIKSNVILDQLAQKTSGSRRIGYSRNGRKNKRMVADNKICACLNRFINDLIGYFVCKKDLAQFCTSFISNLQSNGIFCIPCSSKRYNPIKG